MRWSIAWEKKGGEVRCIREEDALMAWSLAQTAPLAMDASVQES